MNTDHFRRVDDTTKHIRSIKLQRVVDDDPDFSCEGEYTDSAEDWAIERTSGKYYAELDEDFEIPNRGREFRFFKPYAGGEKEGTEDYKKYGLQDFERMESYSRGDWCQIGIYAEASIVINGVIQKLRSGGLWGIESDSEQSHLKEIADEQVNELKDILAELFTKEEIENVEVEEGSEY